MNVAGYTVVAVGYNGKIALSRSQRFRIGAPQSKITLQLLNSHGKYAGPVVLGGSSTRVITGMKAGVNVGTIDVVASKGYAHLARELARPTWTSHAGHTPRTACPSATGSTWVSSCPRERAAAAAPVRMRPTWAFPTSSTSPFPARAS